MWEDQEGARKGREKGAVLLSVTSDYQKPAETSECKGVYVVGGVAVEESIGKSRKRWGLLAWGWVIRARPASLSGYIDPNRIGTQVEEQYQTNIGLEHKDKKGPGCGRKTVQGCAVVQAGKDLCAFGTRGCHCVPGGKESVWTHKDHRLFLSIKN